MRLLSISEHPIHQIRYLTAAPGGVGIIERQLPFLSGEADFLPNNLEAIIITSDLQGIDPKNQQLLGYLVVEELEKLAKLEIMWDNNVIISYIIGLGQVVFMQVSLPLELEELVRENVANGVYSSEDEVICAALQLLKEHSDYLKEEVGRGIDETDKKIFSSMTIEDLKAEGRRRLASLND